MTDFVDVGDLPDEDVEFVKRLVNLLREAKAKDLDKEKESGLKLSAGTWKDLLDPDKLKENIYADRLASTKST